MATKYLRRSAARAGAALFLLTPTLVLGPAHADTVDRVDFTVGTLGDVLVCTSEPSIAQLAVPEGARVVFVNRLGRTATLRLDGRAVATVGSDHAVPVVFRSGSAAVSMAFGCNLGAVQRYPAVTVTVPSATGPSATGPSATGPSATGPSASEETLFAVEPMVPVPGTTRSLSVLLAILASVCVAGVTLAAYRAIVAQRTSRINTA